MHVIHAREVSRSKERGTALPQHADTLQFLPLSTRALRVCANNQHACVGMPTCWKRLRTKAPMLPGEACAPLPPVLPPFAGASS